MNNIQKKTYIDKEETDSMEKTNKQMKIVILLREQLCLRRSAVSCYTSNSKTSSTIQPMSTHFLAVRLDF